MERGSKLENLTTMLILYLKDLTDGVSLSNNERRLLNCYDNRNRIAGQGYMNIVISGLTQTGVYIHQSGEVRSVKDFSNTKPRFPSALVD